MQIATAIIAAALLSGCGESTQESNKSNDSLMTISGRVADGYLVGAKVCLDISENLACESDEPSALSTQGGVYSISGVTFAQAERYRVVAEVSTNSLDEDNNRTISRAYTLYALPKSTFISPISTHLAYVFDANASSDMTKAADVAALSMGITQSDLLLGDYIAKEREGSSDAARLHEFAKVMSALRGHFQESTRSDGTLFSTYFEQKFISKKVDSVMSEINASISLYQQDSATHAQNIYAKMNASDAIANGYLAYFFLIYPKK